MERTRPSTELVKTIGAIEKSGTYASASPGLAHKDLVNSAVIDVPAHGTNLILALYRQGEKDGVRNHRAWWL
jgi:hypothetical protein